MSTGDFLTSSRELISSSENYPMLDATDGFTDPRSESLSASLHDQSCLSFSSRNGQIALPKGRAEGFVGPACCEECSSSLIQNPIDISQPGLMPLSERKEPKVTNVNASESLPLPIQDVKEGEGFKQQKSSPYEIGLSSRRAVEIFHINSFSASDSDPPSLIDEGPGEREELGSCSVDPPTMEINSSRLNSILSTEAESGSSLTIERFTALTLMETSKLSINMTPLPGNVPFLSDYNLLLTKHIEFFEVLEKGRDSNVSPMKVGLRCTHCAYLPKHYPAASFFPSTLGSVASGMGTIATRHFIGARCPLLPKKVVDELIATKKDSTMQTRTSGHIGMEAYMRNICAQYGLVNALGGGIQFRSMEHALTLRTSEHKKVQNNIESAEGSAYDYNNSLNEVNRENTRVQVDDATTASRLETSTLPNASKGTDFLFQKSDVDHFWECKECASVPLYWRASGSIIFGFSEPTEEAVAKHRYACRGTERLAVPRNAIATLFHEENSYVVRVKWESNDFKEYNINDYSVLGYNRKDASLLPGSLVSLDEKVLTTDFAFFSMQQLLACRLIKSGGSRGALPVGYPVRLILRSIQFVASPFFPHRWNIFIFITIGKGLACKHCAGEPNERRFFYTSAEHLRNSFSHIPSHLMECSKCAVEIKAALVAFRKIRNRQKSLLKAGSHKLFIESVWARVHRKRKDYPTLKVVEEDKITFLEPKQKKPKRLGLPENESFDSSRSFLPSSLIGPLCMPEDKSMTTDFTFFTTLQLVKCRLERGCGSRPACPVGFPGLACRHCFGKDSERRFFYTSADHLRNSFSHIPTHLMECKHCPSHVKEDLISLKEIRHQQKSGLRPGSHKLFINQIWDRVHLEDESSKTEASAVISSNLDQVIRLGQAVPTLVNSDRDATIENNTSAAELLDPVDRDMTSNYVYYTLEQVKPYFLTEQELGRGDFCVGYPGLVCIHCENEPNARKFFNRAFSQFYNGFSAIANHLSMCSNTSKEVKDFLSSLKQLKATEDAKLKRGMHRQFMERVWARLMILGKADKSTSISQSFTNHQQRSSSSNIASTKRPLDWTSSPSTVVAASSVPLTTNYSLTMHVTTLPTVATESKTSLVTDADKAYVTEFTFLTFMQVEICSLNDVGNGSRSTFVIGFPGLVCKHCAMQPNARRFFYRTAEILAANYAHIPNHLLCCPKVPEEIKLDLEEKKKVHAAQKKKLQRGSQKEFFNSIMCRMQGSSSAINDNDV